MAGLSQYGQMLLDYFSNCPKHVYAPTCYAEDGSLLVRPDDAREEERSYWENFVEPAVAREIEIRLSMLEDYDMLREFGAERPVFRPMEEE